MKAFDEMDKAIEDLIVAAEQLQVAYDVWMHAGAANQEQLGDLTPMIESLTKQLTNWADLFADKGGADPVYPPVDNTPDVTPPGWNVDAEKL